MRVFTARASSQQSTMHTSPNRSHGKGREPTGEQQQTNTVRSQCGAAAELVGPSALSPLPLQFLSPSRVSPRVFLCNSGAFLSVLSVFLCSPPLSVPVRVIYPQASTLRSQCSVLSRSVSPPAGAVALNLSLNPKYTYDEELFLINLEFSLSLRHLSSWRRELKRSNEYL